VQKSLQGYIHKQVHTCVRKAPHDRAAGISCSVVGHAGRAIRIERRSASRWVQAGIVCRVETRRCIKVYEVGYHI